MISKEIVLEHAKYQMDRINDPEYKPIFAILLIENADKEYIYRQTMSDGSVKEIPSRFPDTGDTFEAGFYYDIDDAINALTSNSCDMQEGIYQAGFVLCRFPGLYPCVSLANRMYFRWDKETQRFIHDEEPAIFAHIAF